MLSEWGEAQGWPLKPIKQLGARAWLLGAEKHKPEGILSFNTQVVIATYLPPKHQHQERQVLAGPRQPTKPRATETNFGTTPTHQQDPWMTWIRNKGGAQTHTPAAQTRFKAADERMAKLERTMQDMGQQQQDFQKNVKGQMEEAAEKAKAFKAEVHESFHSLAADVRTQVAKQIKSSEQTLETSLKEIKHMLMQTGPRGQKRSEEELGRSTDMET